MFHVLTVIYDDSKKGNSFVFIPARLDKLLDEADLMLQVS